MLSKLFLHESKALVYFHDYRIIAGSQCLIKFLRVAGRRNDENIFLPFCHRQPDIGCNAEKSRDPRNRLDFIFFRVFELIENIHICAVEHRITQSQENQILPFVQFFLNQLAVDLPLLIHSLHVSIHLEDHRENFNGIRDIGLCDIKSNGPFLFLRLWCDDHICMLDSFDRLDSQKF